VETTGPGNGALFNAPVAGFVAHVSWRPGEGWRVWVTSWNEDQTPTSGHQQQYTRLTADEAVDVLQAEQATRCEWLRA
jgi:hypothetical protein